jgi:hypothetical protein
MYDEDATPEVKAARLMALKLSVAWAIELRLPHRLPETTASDNATTVWNGEEPWLKGVRELATIAGTSMTDTELTVRRDYLFVLNAVDTLNRRVGHECPGHPRLTDLCHGPVADFFPGLPEQFGMTTAYAVMYITALHRLKALQCPGFTATPAALAGCPDDPRPRAND